MVPVAQRCPGVLPEASLIQGWLAPVQLGEVLPALHSAAWDGALTPSTSTQGGAARKQLAICLFPGPATGTETRGKRQPVTKTLCLS